MIEDTMHTLGSVTEDSIQENRCFASQQDEITEPNITLANELDGLVEISASELAHLELSPSSILILSGTGSPSLDPEFDIHINPPEFFSLFLDAKGVSFVQHFESIVSGSLVISQSSSNYFCKTFLLLAHLNESIGHALASWGAFYVHRNHHLDVQCHLSQAIALTAQRFPHGLGANSYDVFTLLCFYLIMVGFFVCVGDVSRWWLCVEQCHGLILRHGGMDKLSTDFGQLNDIKFLISNFFYHDVLLSRAFIHGPLIRAAEYDKVFSNGFFDSSYGMDPLQGCLNPVYLLLAEELEVRASMKVRRNRLNDMLNDELTEDDPSVQHEFNVMRSLYLECCEQEVSRFETRITDCVIDSNLIRGASDKELHMSVFEVFRLTCKLYWVLYIKEALPLANELQYLLVQLLDKIDVLIDTQMIVVLCLPLLLAGVASNTRHDRRRVERTFHDMMERSPIQNVRRAWIVVQEVWKRDGFLEWAEICEERGWELCVC